MAAVNDPRQRTLGRRGRVGSGTQRGEEVHGVAGGRAGRVGARVLVARRQTDLADPHAAAVGDAGRVQDQRPGRRRGRRVRRARKERSGQTGGSLPGLLDEPRAVEPAGLVGVGVAVGRCSEERDAGRGVGGVADEQAARRRAERLGCGHGDGTVVGQAVTREPGDREPDGTAAGAAGEQSGGTGVRLLAGSPADRSVLDRHCAAEDVQGGGGPVRRPDPATLGGEHEHRPEPVGHRSHGDRASTPSGRGEPVGHRRVEGRSAGRSDRCGGLGGETPQAVDVDVAADPGGPGDRQEEQCRHRQGGQLDSVQPEDLRRPPVLGEHHAAADDERGRQQGGERGRDDAEVVGEPVREAARPRRRGRARRRGRPAAGRGSRGRGRSA